MNRFYNRLFNQTSKDIKEKVLSQIYNLEQSTVLGLTKEETELLRKRLGVYGKEASLYKNMVGKDLTVSKLITKLSYIEIKTKPALEELRLEENLKTHQIETLSAYSMAELITILGKEEAEKVRGYAHGLGILLQGETEEDRLPISTLGLEPRYTNGLMRIGVKTMGSLLKMSLEDIENIRGFGVKAKAEIKKSVEDAGYHLAPSEIPEKKRARKLTK